MKLKKFEKIKDKVEELIAEQSLKNPHYLRDEVIVAYFSEYKEKHILKALKELR